MGLMPNNPSFAEKYRRTVEKNWARWENWGKCSIIVVGSRLKAVKVNFLECL